MRDILIIIRFLFIVFIGLLLISFLIKPIRKRLIEDFKDKEFRYVMIVLLGIFLIVYLCVGTLILSIFSYRTNYEKRDVVEETEKEIVSLNLNKDINGSVDGGFILGIGSVGGTVNTENYYYFYTKENNRYKLEKINAEEVFIEETNDNNSKIIYRKTKTVKDKIRNPNKFGEWLGLEVNKFENVQSILDLMNKTEYEIILYIPIGSIIENFNPNVE